MKLVRLLVVVALTSFVCAGGADGAPARGVIPKVHPLYQAPLHNSIGDYFAVSGKKLADIGKRFPLPEDDLVVALFIATRSNNDPVAIAALRLKGMSWMAVVEYLGYTEELLDRPFSYEDRSPNSPLLAVEEEKRRSGKGKGKGSKLSDREFFIKANVKFLSEHFGVTSGRVKKMIAKGMGLFEVEAILRGEVKGKKGRKGKKGKKGRGR